MSLKNRNIAALALLLLVAFCATLGKQLLDSARSSNDPLPDGNESSVVYEQVDSSFSSSMVCETSAEMTYETTYEMTFEGTNASGDTNPFEESVTQDNLGGGSGAERLGGILFCLVSAAVCIITIFFLYPKTPVFGLDGICLILASLAVADAMLISPAALPLSFGICMFAILTGVWELTGWMREKCSLSWCLVQRAARRCAVPQLSLLTYVGWTVCFGIGALFFFVESDRRGTGICGVLCLASAAFGLLCLWRYGADLSHFLKQLDNQRQGKPIAVGGGAFSHMESQLLDMQKRNEEAVRTAVTSERFKVELISNVSHDLRTPLTSILGYSELLKNESLSPEGSDQLRLLHQKAGYMNELVESLFELTKVSSGVLESKKEKIDLIRLLEQTIGLFDDQLATAGLSVRRNYASDAVIVTTDGARMHQVFSNLLGNAIKYAMAGTRIYLDVRERQECVSVRMVNTASYEMDFRPEEITQRFVRGDKARSTKGSGLGLAIAQTYTQSVGGTFRVMVDGDQFSAIVELPRIERNL